MHAFGEDVARHESRAVARLMDNAEEWVTRRLSSWASGTSTTRSVHRGHDCGPEGTVLETCPSTSSSRKYTYGPSAVIGTTLTPSGRL